MMSKEETIGTLENAKHFTYGDEKFNDAFDSAINYLKETMWIPVTERLPDEEGAYIVTERDKDMKNPCYVMREWYVNGKWSRVDTLGFEVTAWMPLPKPYEEE